MKAKIYSEHFDSNRVFISLELLTQCNYRCSYCYIFQNPDNAHLLATDDFHNADVHTQNLRIINKLGSVKTPMHLFVMGGEPTIYQKLPEILKEIDDLPKNSDIEQPIVEIITNGKKFEDLEFAKKILEPYPKMRVTISIHYEYIKITDYKKIIKNLGEVLDIDEDSITLYIILPETIDTFLEYADDIIQTLDENYKIGIAKIIVSVVNGYNITEKLDLINFYIEYFESRNVGYLLDSEWIKIEDFAGEQLPLGRFDFLKINAEKNINYNLCNFNVYVIDKTGDCDGTSCRIVKDTLNILDSTDEEINSFLSIRPVLCTEPSCPVNCTCMPKRVVDINI